MFVHLHLHTPYSFLDGASHIETMVRAAAACGMPALAMTDHDNTAAAVKFVTLCRAYGLRPILGAELTMEDDTHLTLLARDREGYAELGRLLTAAHALGGRLNPHLPWNEARGSSEFRVPSSEERPASSQPSADSERRDRCLLLAVHGLFSCRIDQEYSSEEQHYRHLPPPISCLPTWQDVNNGPEAVTQFLGTRNSELGTSLICLSGCRRGRVPMLVREHRYEEARALAERLRDRFGAEAFFIELQDDLTPDCQRVNRELVTLARRIGVGVVATNNVHYAYKEDYVAHDVLRCIHAGVTTAQPHPDRPLNAERYLKTPREMEELFAWCPEAIENTLRIAEMCEETLPDNEEITPRYPVPDKYPDAATYLHHLTWKGARARYKERLTEEVEERINFELKVIIELGYADYFLMVWQIVRWARKQGIRATGRGSAADSCVAYCLLLTDVDVIERNLPFARFLVPGKTPDIDIDFPSDRRDDVFRHIVEQYGEEHVGMVCTFHTYWARSAVRDIGKALGIPQEVLELLSRRLGGFVRANMIEEAFEKYAELRQHIGLKERFKLLFELCGRIAGFPRHIGTHSSGIVIRRVPLGDIAPLQPSARGITQIWTLDKDDAEAVGAIKFDVLSLRALSAIADAERDIAAWESGDRGQIAGSTPGAQRSEHFRYDRIPGGDPETYRMLQAGAAIGTFQLESAGQMSLAVVLEPRQFEDLVAAVALIRPGPIRGGLVTRFVACRNGWARADLLHPCLEKALGKTYGCIIFQEQANDVIAAMTGLSDGEADRFRKGLNKHYKMNTMEQAREEFIGMVLKRRPETGPECASLLFDQIEGWSGYGFTEGHAASFALTGYRSAYLSVHYPAEYFAGLMNHQPMGFFNANTLAGEARRRGVSVLPVDINRSGDKCYAEQVDAIRLGLRMVSELKEEDIEAIVASRPEWGYASLLDFCARVPLHRNRLENLILAGAFDLLHEHRRGLLWRLDETVALAQACRAQSDGSQAALRLGSAAGMQTPVSTDIEDFTIWDKFLWTWRLTGVCAECHVFSHLRENLRPHGVMTAYDAMQQRHGAWVTVAGLNIRPHRPPTRSGRPVLFTLIEDETAMLQATCVDEALSSCTPVFLTSPVVVVSGILQQRGKGCALLVKQAKPLRMQEFAVSARPARHFSPYQPVKTHALVGV